MSSIKDVIKELELIAPASLQEGYDNAGLIVGDASKEVKGIMFCLDSTEDVLDEAIEKGCNLIIAHHPIVFSGLKRFTGKNYVQRTVIKAIKNDLAIYAIHTNLDNVLYKGVNERICQTIGLKNYRILSPKSDMLSVDIICSGDSKSLISELKSRLESHHLSGKETSINSLETAEKAIIKVRIPAVLRGELDSTIRDNKSVTIESTDYLSTKGKTNNIGSGMIGELPEALPAEEFLQLLKTNMQLKVLKHTDLCKQTIKKVAVCGGAGGFLLSKSISQKADIFITSDYKYHEFFDADNRIIIADIGHFESEQFTINLLCEIISEKFSSFANYCTSVNTNPVHYF